MKHRAFLLLTFLLLCTSYASIYAKGKQEQPVEDLTPTLYQQAEILGDATTAIYPGSTLGIIIKNIRDNDEDISVVIRNNSKAFVRSKIIFEADKQGFTFIGVPSTLEPGTYTLAIEKKQDDITEFLAEQTIEILNIEFKKETIVVGSSTGTRTPNPTVVSEAKFIWNLTGKVFNEDRFQYDNFLLPIKKYKYISGEFGDRRLYVNSEQESRGRSVHNALDFAAPTTTEIKAPARGRVVLTKNRVVTGNTIVISHYPGIFSLYYHLSKIFVKPGDVVEQNQLIGEVGSTGFSTGPHLHWEMRVNNVQVQPINFMGELDIIKTLEVTY